MSEDSKKRQELQRQIQNRTQVLKLDTVEKAALFLSAPKDWELVAKAATPSGKEGFEAQRLRICFDFLKWNTCNFEHFDPTKARALVKKLEAIEKCDVNSLASSGIIRHDVHNNPPYSSLFDGLSPEVEMKETEMTENGRIFFYVAGSKFYVVSIESNHRNI